MKKTDKRRKGFTLIELIVVIAILAILAAIAVPNFIGLTKKANNATEVSAAAQYATAMNVANALAVTDAQKILELPADDTVIPDIDAKLLAAGVPVNVDADMDDAKLFTNVFYRLKMENGVFMVDSAKKGDIPIS